MSITDTKGELTSEEVENIGFRGQDANNAEVGVWKLMKTHKILVAYSLLANIGPLMFGYDFVIVGSISALPAFQEVFGSLFHGKLIIPALWLGLWNGFVQVGTAMGSILAGWSQDRFGRRAAFGIGGLIATAGTAIVYTSGMPGDVTHRRIEFLFGKIIVGISCGVLMSTCQTYISEISPKSLRGLLLGLYPFTLSLGHLFAIAAVFAQIRNHTSSAYQIPFATQWIFSVIALAAYFALPESPVWLVANNRVEEAVTASHKLGLSGTTGSNNMVGDMQITMALENNHEESPTWKECFIGTNFRRTRIIIWLNILQQLVGIALLSNAAYFLQMAGMSATYSLMVNQVGVTANIVACIISWFSVRVYGRRQLILFSVILDAAVWLAMGISGLFNNSTAKWIVGVTLLVFGFTNSLGVASVVPIISSEISSVRLRSKSAGIGFTVQALGAWLFSFFTPYLYNADEANWGGKIGFFMSGLSLIGFIVIWLEVPETKGRTFLEIDYLFREGTRTRAFCTTLVPDTEITVDDLKGGNGTKEF